MLNDDQRTLSIHIIEDIDGTVCHNVSVSNLSFTTREHKLIVEALRLLRQVFNYEDTESHDGSES